LPSQHTLGRGVSRDIALAVSMSQSDIALLSLKDTKHPGDIAVLSHERSMSVFSMWNHVEWIGNTRCQNHRFHMFCNTVRPSFRPCSTVTVKRWRFPTSNLLEHSTIYLRTLQILFVLQNAVLEFQTDFFDDTFRYPRHLLLY